MSKFMFVIQIVLSSAIFGFGLVLAIFGNLTIGLIGCGGGALLYHLTIEEYRNQPRQW
jgi:uncharacterized membrane protein